MTGARDFWSVNFGRSKNQQQQKIDCDILSKNKPKKVGTLWNWEYAIFIPTPNDNTVES